MMNNDATTKPDEQGGEELYQGIAHRLFDGYDGGRDVNGEEAAKLLESAPPYIKARIKEWTQQRAALEAEAARKAGHQKE